MPPITIIVILLALLYAFLNGVMDSSSIVATMISSRAASMRLALLITAGAEFLGPLILGTAVAETIGRNIVDARSINTHVILAAILAAVGWNLLSSFLGIPSSSSHALVGGLIGSVVISAGANAILIPGLIKVIISLFISPLIGFLIGYVALRMMLQLTWDQSPSISNIFKRLQIPTIITLGLSHGSNDAPKTMGIITLALMTSHLLDSFRIPVWVIVSSALAIALGTAVGRRRLIRTVGGKFFKIKPIDAFSAQFASALVLVSGSIFGGPMSASQVLSSAVMGVGAAERPNKVRWTLAQDIVTAWLLTIPLTALISAGLYQLLNPLIH